MPLAGRCAILFSMSRLPYAREEGGLGQLFYSESSKSAALGALLLLLLLLAVLTPSQLAITLVAVLLVNLLFNRWCRIQLGGATGDTLGAVCELTEMIVVIAFSATLTLI
jgi:adenosylcobinamide-GDP ribazoletransferase